MAAHVFRWIDDHLYWKPLWVIVIFHRNLNLMYFVSLILSHLSPVHITLTFSLVLICARVFILCSLSVKRKRKKEREWSREGGYGRKLQSLMWGKPFGMRNELSESLVSLSVHSCNVCMCGKGGVGWENWLLCVRLLAEFRVSSAGSGYHSSALADSLFPPTQK